MTEQTPDTVVCPFCGKARTVIHVHDDGRDDLARGQVSNYKLDDGCGCPLGKLAHEKVAIKQMCYNCNYFKAGKCTNKRFQMPPEIRIRYPDRCCKYWSLNLKIFRSLFKEDNK